VTRLVSLSCHDLTPFFGPAYAALAERLSAPALAPLADEHDAVRAARALGALGLYAYLVPEAHGGAAVGKREDATYVDVRSLVLVREALGQVSPLADAIFAVQGLAAYPIVLAGSDEQRRRCLPGVLSGETIGGFALTEPEAGSDVASLNATARRDGDGWVLDGDKTLISNVPIAQHYVVFANADPARGRKGITAFFVEHDAPGLTLSEIPMSIPHPIGRLSLSGCRLPGDALVGAVGAGFKLAMETLDAFRISVGAAANGMARAALAASLEHVARRRQFGAPLAEQQMVRAALADMATELDAARLLVARAAHLRDEGGGRVSTEAAMAKMYATEAAQRIIDRAVQLHGGSGVCLGSEVERLYREIRPLRIYEGTTEIQKLIIAKGVLEREEMQKFSR
jgi:acyl-CoA dehydrogenase